MHTVKPFWKFMEKVPYKWLLIGSCYYHYYYYIRKQFQWRKIVLNKKTKSLFLQIAWSSNFNSIMLHIRHCSLLCQLKACAFAISQSNSYLPVYWLFKFCSCVITSRSNENHSVLYHIIIKILKDKKALYLSVNVFGTTVPIDILNWHWGHHFYIFFNRWDCHCTWSFEPCEGLAILKAN